MAVEGINEELQNFLLKRNHYISRFENGTISEIMEPYHRAKFRIANSIQKLQDTGQGYTLQYRIDRLNSQMDEINLVLGQATSESINGLSENLSHFAYDHKELYEELLDTRFGEIGINITRIPFEHVDRMLSNPLGMQGADWQARFTQRYGEQLVRIKEELAQSMILGEDMGKAARRLFGIGEGLTGAIGEKIQNGANIIARTEIMRTQNIVNKEIYDANTDVIKGLEFIATLDDRTCLLPFTLIYTKTGWKTVESVETGDLVFTHKGEWRKVIAKTKQSRSTYLKVRLSNGKELCLTPDHEVSSDGRWVEIKDLRIGDCVDGFEI